MSNVEELNVQGIVLDELPAGRHLIAHQQGKERVGLGRVGNVHLQEAAFLWIHRRLKELLRVHFPEALVALDAQALTAIGPDLGDNLKGSAKLRLRFGLLARIFCHDVERLLGGAEPADLETYGGDDLEELRHLGALEDLVERDPPRRGGGLGVRPRRVCGRFLGEVRVQPALLEEPHAGGVVQEELMRFPVALADPGDIAGQGVGFPVVPVEVR